MKFENPYALWALLLLAIPIIIHLFHFKRFKTLYFSSLIFVKQVEQETKSVKKLKHLLILISRLLAFIALVLAFAKPYFPLNSKTPLSKLTAIYIDNSFSMTNLGSEGQLFEVAKMQAKKIVNTLGDDEQFYIVSNNQSTEEQRVYSKKEATERINQLTISPLSKSFSETANWVQTQLENSETKTLNNYIFISDFQNTNNSKDLLINKQTNIFPVQLKAQKSSNISIDTAWFTNPNFNLNTQNELFVVVRNYGNQTLDNVALNVKTNQTQRDIFVSIRANDTAHVVVNYSDNQKGWVNGKLSIIDEGIIFDDDLYFSYYVQNKNNTVVINGEDAVGNVRSVYELDKFYNVDEFNYKSIDNAVLQKANTIVLNGLNSYSSGLIEQLTTKAKDGSGIIIFPAKSANMQELNTLLKALGLSNVTAKVNEKFKITNVNSNDLFFKGVFKKTPKNITLPTINSYWKVTPSGNVVSLLKLENDAPILVRSAQNNTFLFASSLTKEDGNFLTNAIFSTVLLRVGELGTSAKPLYLTIGKETQYPIVQAQPERPLKLVNEQFEFIPFKRLSQGKSWISVLQIPNKNIVAGQYQVVDEQEVAQLALNYNRDESVMNYVKLDSLTHSLKELGFENVKSSVLENNAMNLPINTDNKKEYWKQLLLLSLLFFLVEMTLIKFWK